MEEPPVVANHIREKLLPYQIEHVSNLIYILTKNVTALDSSDTGTGKTYTAIASCAQMNLSPIILCPKSVINSWKHVCKIFNVNPITVINYESAKNGIVINKENLLSFDKGTKTYTWETEKFNDAIYIFDEVHKCSSQSTLNGKLLLSAKDKNIHMLLLSATIADHPEKFRLFFYVLNFLDPVDTKKKNISFSQYMSIIYRWVTRDSKPMNRIHNMLYPERASGMKISFIGHMFPETQIITQPYTITEDREKDIEKEYRSIHKELTTIKKKDDNASNLVKIMRAHQKIELLKVPLIVELTNDYIENGFYVVIFVNFTQTLNLLSNLLYTKSLVYGGQSERERSDIVNTFMENKSRVIICTIKSGGTAISLDDQHGGHPRVSLISPTWDSVDLIQTLGRIHRAKTKSKSLQRILYIANTIEENIAEKLKQKLYNINEINNGDVDLTNIVFEKERQNI